MPTSQINSAELDAKVRRELVLLCLSNASKSVVAMPVAGWFVAWLGYQAGVRGMALVVFLMTTVAAGWRFVLARRHAERKLTPRVMDHIEIELAGNSLFAGVMWGAATFGIYPRLDPGNAAVHLGILVGSAAIAAHFMTLVRWSYPLLLAPSLGSLALVSLLDSSAHSVPAAVLAVIFVITLARTGRQYRETTARAIRHGLEADMARAAVQRAKEDAEAGAVAKSQFLATMSHEIRTPMNGVLGSLELLRRSQLTEEQRRLVRTAATSGESLMAILNDVLDHSKIEAGKLVLASAPLSLHTLAGSVVGLFRANAETKHLALVLKIDEDVPEWVVGDSQRLKQVLLNLVSNAIKFTNAGGVQLRLRTAPGAVQGTAGVMFEVRDSGVGMSNEAIKRLFLPFTQLGQDRASRRGTGLGLAISQRIVEAMGSSIEVKSEPGMGSTFHFALQLKRWDEEPPAPEPETASGPFDAIAPVSATVLVAEDDAVNRLIARAMLESLGLQVVEAGDGLEALEKVRVHAVDLVFMDCQMPNLDGYAATRRWRELEARLGRRRTPIIALTANAFDEDVAQARAAGMDGHLAKPYTREQLREKLQQWL